MKTKIAAAVFAALTLGAVSVAGTSQAQAHWHGGGWGWGGVGLGFAAGALIGAAATNDYVYVRRCSYVRQFDQFGNYVGTARVCRY
jgi:hypothetical protein